MIFYLHISFFLVENNILPENLGVAKKKEYLMTQAANVPELFTRLKGTYGDLVGDKTNELGKIYAFLFVKGNICSEIEIMLQPVETRKTMVYPLYRGEELHLITEETLIYKVLYREVEIPLPNTVKRSLQHIERTNKETSKKRLFKR